MKRVFKQFSFPGPIPSHVAPETPGSLYEVVGNSAMPYRMRTVRHFDNPDLIVATVIGES
jgi:phosphoketolase